MADVPTYLFDRRAVVAVAFPLADDFVSVSGQVVEVGGAPAGDTRGAAPTLRVQFKVSKQLVKDPNTAEISIYNLAESTRSRMQSQAAKVVLRVGYLSTIGQIFVGDAHSIEHVREGADWVTKIHAGDGERGLTNARVSQSFAAGTSVTDAIAAVSRVAGFDVTSVIRAGGLKDLEGRQFSRGYVAHGSVGRELDKILRGAGFEWSVQDGKLQVLKKGEGTTERVVELSPSSGLIGSPEYCAPEKPKASGKGGGHGHATTKEKPPVLKFKALISPEIKPGRKVLFSSARHSGVHRVTKATFTGDTHGADWYVSGEAEVVES